MKIRIAVYIGQNGAWQASGSSHLSDEAVVEMVKMCPGGDPSADWATALHWVEVDIPVPGVIQGSLADDLKQIWLQLEDLRGRNHAP